MFSSGSVSLNDDDDINFFVFFKLSTLETKVESGLLYSIILFDEYFYGYLMRIPASVTKELCDKPIIMSLCTWLWKIALRLMSSIPLGASGSR